MDLFLFLIESDLVTTLEDEAKGRIPGTEEKMNYKGIINELYIYYKCQLITSIRFSLAWRSFWRWSR